jgi:hypothetical protein
MTQARSAAIRARAGWVASFLSDAVLSLVSVTDIGDAIRQTRCL